MLELVLLDGSRRRFRLDEGQELTVGAAARCEVRLAAPDVSRAHALLTNRSGKIIVLDLGSTNGTFVNGKRVKEAELTSGDFLRFSSIVAQVLPPSGDSSDERERAGSTIRVPRPAAAEPGEGSQTSDQMPGIVHESLDWLLARWGGSARSAQEELVEWLVSERHLGGAALLEVVGSEIMVAAAQGEVGEVLEDPACEELVRRGEEGKGGPESVGLTIADRSVVAMKAPDLPWLLLVPNQAMPEFRELSLIARLLAVARRLDRGAAT